ncbi:MAG: hypothetical protein LBU00_04690 [Treponema sp.]|jgi:hypothetical protein|nr:hypothetical protein [Treponema sp.]
MPLRILQYIGRVYEKLTAGLKAFGRKLIKIPRPEFIVLYNGVDPYPDESILNLSDAFEDVSDLGIELPPDLELRVKVYNINKGHNEEKLRKCGALAGYSEFVGKVREITAEMTGGRVPLKLSDEELSKAIKGAMGWCIGHDVLREFFERNGSEVMNMLFNEFSLEDELAVEREVAWEEGREERETEIAKNALAEGLPVEVIRKITGLDQATLTQLAAQ